MPFELDNLLMPPYANRQEVKAYLFTLKTFLGKPKYTIDEIESKFMLRAINDEYYSLKEHHNYDAQTMLKEMCKRSGSIDKRYRGYLEEDAKSKKQDEKIKAQVEAYQKALEQQKKKQ